MVRRVFLIRHCQSEANRDERAESRGDSALTPLGREQARRRAAALEAHELEAVTLISSPLQRASRTAGAIAERHGWALSHDHRLIEGDLGRLENLSYAEVLTLVAEGETWVRDDIHGGESLAVAGQRMLEALTAALEASDGPVILVSHGFAISALLLRLGQEGQPLSNGDMLEMHLGDEAEVMTIAHHPLGG